MADDFTSAAKLCDDDGIVRHGPMHKGTDYTCTGSAHFGGEHIRCTNPIHSRRLSEATVDPSDPLALQETG